MKSLIKVILLIGILVGTLLWSDANARGRELHYPPVLEIHYFCMLDSGSYKKCTMIEFLQDIADNGRVGRMICHDVMNDIQAFCSSIPKTSKF